MLNNIRLFLLLSFKMIDKFILDFNNIFRFVIVTDN